MKVAIYARVSTEEQAQHGISIDAQLEELRTYAKNHNYSIYNEYVDAGYSGGLLHRPALDMLLNDAKEKKFQVVLFVKLDRWFRSVPHYYKIQEILEQNNINWIATQEDYETITSSGKFKVNIMLSVSQQFKEATSERIKSVIRYKKEKGEALNGVVPYGYKIENKHFVIDEEKAEHIKEMFEKYDETNCISETHEWWINKYDRIGYDAFKKRLKDTRYIGEYKKNNIIDTITYPAIIDKKIFYRVNDLLKSNKNIKSNVKRDYIFSGLFYCGVCGAKGFGFASGYKNHKYNHYRCYKKVQRLCNSHSITEAKLERIVLSKLQLDAKYELEEITKIKEKPINNTPAIRKKQERLKTLYIEGIINKKEFDLKYDELENKIVIKKPKEEKIKMLKLCKNGSYLDLYNKLDSKHKNLFYKQIISKIIFTDENDVKIIFND